MRYLIFILLCLPTLIFSQIGGGINTSLSYPPQDFEKICYTDGTDTLEGFIKFESPKKSPKIYDLGGNLVSGAEVIDSKYCSGVCPQIIAVEAKFDYLKDSGDSEQLYTLFTKTNPDNQTQEIQDGFIDKVVSGTHPTLGFSIVNWSVHSICSTTFPENDPNDFVWLLGSPSSFSTVTLSESPNAPPTCSSDGTGGCVAIQEIKEKDCDGVETYRYVTEDGNGNLIAYEIQGEVQDECQRTNLTILCKDICYQGVKIPFEYAVSDDGVYAWFKNLNTQEFISGTPDFGEDCQEVKEIRQICKCDDVSGDSTLITSYVDFYEVGSQGNSKLIGSFSDETMSVPYTPTSTVDCDLGAEEASIVIERFVLENGTFTTDNLTTSFSYSVVSIGDGVTINDSFNTYGAYPTEEASIGNDDYNIINNTYSITATNAIVVIYQKRLN